MAPIDKNATYLSLGAFAFETDISFKLGYRGLEFSLAAGVWPAPFVEGTPPDFFFAIFSSQIAGCSEQR
jgi:hypothetical protein